ncbi:hypothetical protein LOSG293_390080 [Secundilactobacillus oryzae JCM 18671]|uniref:Uncharacterized protein n=1 Tax=Secundilactobacillus oryzae JCM 18671 TaxID=1291743 RepID=A0A081BKL2_9LACO|nr:hypothetical protein [Secundilactobacillus oryzae]GAK48580.1 hypothetical protein LOSG293_390080 [Secundilactobacillus oryzae JCM 18671]
MRLTDFQLMARDLDPELLLCLSIDKSIRPITAIELDDEQFKLIATSGVPMHLAEFISKTTTLPQTATLFAQKETLERVYGFKQDGNQLIID